MHTVATIPAKQVVLLGDFNLPNIHWPNWLAPVGDALDFLLLDTFASLRFQQCVSLPTRALKILDLILVPKEPAGVSFLQVFDVGLMANCDHTSILFDINVSHLSYLTNIVHNFLLPLVLFLVKAILRTLIAYLAILMGMLFFYRTFLQIFRFNVLWTFFIM